MSKSRLNILIITSILAFPLTYGLLPPFLNIISKTYTLDYQQTGFIYTFFNIGFLISTLIIGYISDKFGIRIIIWGLLINCAASFIIFTSSSYYFFIAAILILGVSLGIEDVLSAASLSRLNPEKKGFFINIMQFAGCMGGIIVSTAAGLMAQNNINWKLAYMFSCLFIFVLFLFLFKEPFPDKNPSADISFKAAASMLKNMDVIMLCVTFFCIFSIEGGVIGWLGIYMIKIYNVSDLISGLSISLMYLAIGVSRLIIAFFSDRVKHINLIFISSILSTIFLILALISNDFVVSMMFFFLTMFTSAGIFTTTISFANTLFPMHTGTLLSVMFSIGTIGSIFMPGLIGAISQAATLKAGLSVLVYLFIVIAMIFTYLYLRSCDILSSKN